MAIQLHGNAFLPTVVPIWDSKLAFLDAFTDYTAYANEYKVTVPVEDFTLGIDTTNTFARDSTTITKLAEEQGVEKYVDGEMKIKTSKVLNIPVHYLSELAYDRIALQMGRAAKNMATVLADEIFSTIIPTTQWNTTTNGSNYLRAVQASGTGAVGSKVLKFKDINRMSTIFDQNDVPEDRYILMSPYHRECLINENAEAYKELFSVAGLNGWKVINTNRVPGIKKGAIRTTTGGSETGGDQTSTNSEKSDGVSIFLSKQDLAKAMMPIQVFTENGGMPTPKEQAYRTSLSCKYAAFILRPTAQSMGIIVS